MDGSYDSSRFSFLKCLNTDFPIVATHVYIPSNRAGVPFFPHILTNICFPDDSHSDWDERESPGLIFISHMMKGIEYFFKIIYWPSVFFFFLLRTIYSFDWSIGWLIWLDDFLIFNFCSSSGGLNINYLMMCSGQRFFFSNSGIPPAPILCTLAMVLLAGQNREVLCDPTLAIFCTVGVLVRKSLPLPLSWSILPMFSSNSFRVSDLSSGLQSILNQSWGKLLHRWKFSFFWTTCWRDHLFPHFFWRGGKPCWKLYGCSCVGWFLCLLFYSTGSHVCFCPSTEQFLGGKEREELKSRGEGEKQRIN